MMTSFQKVLEHRDRLLHQRSVWRELDEHLQKFLDTDAIQATVGIKTDGSGLTVPQVDVSVVRSAVGAKIAEIDAELTKIDRREVADVKQTKGKAGAKKAAPQKGGNKKGAGKPSSAA
jgi:hypothetical protein